MRYGIISDIHGNLEALKKVLEILKKSSIDKYLCLGDLVGYGADPGPCMESVRSLNPLTVVGNHDWVVLHPKRTTSFNPYAREAILWTMRQILTTQKDYLASLPFIEEGEDFILVHGSLDEPKTFNYIFSLRDLELNFRLLQKKICFFGHSHIPGIYSYSLREKRIELLPVGMVKFEDEKKYLINAGSVGQPRDRNPSASFAIYDTEEKTLWIKRCFYDIRRAQEKILQAGLPKILAERLAFGK